MGWLAVFGAAFIVWLIVRIFNRREAWAIELGIWLALAVAVATTLAFLFVDRSA